jgi:hypothetical protein
MTIIKTVDVTTGEENEREATTEELSDIARRDDLMQNIYEDLENKSKAKAAVIAKLGLTADEVAALLG